MGRDKRTAVFPKLVYAIKKGHNETPLDPFYDVKTLALECTSKRMYPDILSYEQIVETTGSFKFPMGCRSFLHQWCDESGKEIHEGRNNLGVVTLNLPRIALDAKGDLNKFYVLLDKRMKIVKEALDIRINALRGVKASVAPILYTEGACGIRLKPDDEIMQLFENGRASISCGYIGLHETAEILFGEFPHILESREKQQKMLLILAAMKTYTEKWTEETGFAFGIYGTPSESLCHRFCKIDKSFYGNMTGFDKGYYTNSFHLDVQKNTNPFNKIDFEKQFIKYSSGGFISYGEFPSMIHNTKALETVWDYALKNLPYYGTNTPIDRCMKCGYNGEFSATSKGYECPQCGNTDSESINVTRRVCGYLGSPDSRPFNKGKQSEVIRRVKHV